MATVRNNLPILAIAPSSKISFKHKIFDMSEKQIKWIKVHILAKFTFKVFIHSPNGVVWGCNSNSRLYCFVCGSSRFTLSTKLGRTNLANVTQIKTT